MSEYACGDDRATTLPCPFRLQPKEWRSVREGVRGSSAGADVWRPRHPSCGDPEGTEAARRGRECLSSAISLAGGGTAYLAAGIPLVPRSAASGQRRPAGGRVSGPCGLVCVPRSSWAWCRRLGASAGSALSASTPRRAALVSESLGSAWRLALRGRFFLRVENQQGNGRPWARARVCARGSRGGPP